MWLAKLIIFIKESELIERVLYYNVSNILLQIYSMICLNLLKTSKSWERKKELLNKMTPIIFLKFSRSFNQ